ncbi:hypothetical protein N431DRAFT_514683 [Stipitochalara longipes BDJ]|nr:hypothetical protein N431DRAFT_514683 [Stipitochalara longipes BDJ]
MSVSELDWQRSTGAGLKWASGRRLTDAQRARKRAVDRARNKQQRLSTLNRIAELEVKLQSVLPEAPFNSSERRITTDTGTAFQRRQHHASTDVQRNETRLIPSSELETIDWPLMAASGDTVNIASLPSCWQSEYELSSNSHNNSPQEDLTHLNMSNLQRTMDVTPSAPSIHLPKSIVLRRGDIPTLWISEAVRTNNISLLMQAQDARKVEVCLEDHINQDVLIRGIIEGWEVVKSRVKVCPLWEILRSIDHLLFWMASPITRLVMLRMIHEMLLFKVSGKRLDELPSWYRPRPTQTIFPHDELIDFFAWPGIRERLVVSKQDLLTNDFWDCFRRNFRFQWPLSFREIYQLNPYTSRYAFSALFQGRLRDISMWQMEQQFFAAFPEFLDDISASEPTLSELMIEPGSSEILLQSGAAASAWNNLTFDGVDALDIGNLLNVHDHDVSLSVQRLDTFSVVP